MSFKTEFKENVVFSMPELFVGSHEDFKLILGACFVLNYHPGGFFQISILRVSRTANWSISSARLHSSALLTWYHDF